ncbi:MAG: hypothetical protein QOE07_2297 [Acidimicrobiaceae bacterium]|jgi:hypothetical protein|nr:hypothetical protein [Acidimicrobiaceae bacterium]MDQ1413709.1 hypothetical protein [Acidimicrobiaceae bacterium]MDQ1417771.1 hypothetical protein [Acidimicrobiaceae bacterium]
MSSDTSASLRPMRGMSPSTRSVATRSAAADAAASAATSPASLTVRSGPVTVEAVRQAASGSWAWSWRRNVAQARSEMASCRQAPINRVTSSTGSAVSSQASTVKRQGLLRREAPPTGR